MPSVFIYGALMGSAIKQSKAEPAFVPDHKVAFLIRGIPVIEPAFAAIVPQSGAQAWGIITYYNQNDWTKLTMHEVSYAEKEIIACKPNGEQVKCITLVPTRHLLSQEKSPSARYARKLYLAAQYHQLPKATVKQYEQLMRSGNKITQWFRFISSTHRHVIVSFGKKPAIIITSLLLLLFIGLGISTLFILPIWLLFAR